MNTCISAYRRFNRFYTNHTGLLRHYLPGGQTTLSEARILLEIGHAPGITATELGRKLAMDRGQLSRILKKMAQKQLVRKKGVPAGRNPIPLFLTDDGNHLLYELEKASNDHAQALLTPLAPATRTRIVNAMQEIEQAFDSAQSPSPLQPVIRTSRAGDLGWVLMRHGQLYAQEYGFNAEFEKYVLQGMLPFAEQADLPGNELWIAEQAGTALGAIAVMRTTREEAQLRWFVVEPTARGTGLGKQLLRTALKFCREQAFTRVFLLTLDILPAARHLYESFGFRLTNSTPACHWGHSFCDERWERELTAD